MSRNAMNSTFRSGRYCLNQSSIKLFSYAMNIYKDIKFTPFYEYHLNEKAKMFDFCGWEMPLQYESIEKEHYQCRNQCSLFDVSHMLQTNIYGKRRYDFIEKLVVGDISEISADKKNDQSLLLVSNACNSEKVKRLFASTKSSYFANDDINIEYSNNALLSLQGPGTQHLLENIPELKSKNLNHFYFMDSFVIPKFFNLEGPFRITRCGYTGEDGVEISLPQKYCTEILSKIFQMNGSNRGEKNVGISIKPAGLLIRDVLRLEAGLCLYGSDINEKTCPIEAGLGWTIGKRRVRDKDFPGALKILESMKTLKNPEMKHMNCRRGFSMKMRGPIPRHGYTIHIKKANNEYHQIGYVTSGTFSPAFKTNIAMGYLYLPYASVGNIVYINSPLTRKMNEYEIVKLPFLSPHYYYMSK
ncbi:unnamed protein product [Gordionus sp. m RMFG-2023]